MDWSAVPVNKKLAYDKTAATENNNISTPKIIRASREVIKRLKDFHQACAPEEREERTLPEEDAPDDVRLPVVFEVFDEVLGILTQFSVQSYKKMLKQTRKRINLFEKIQKNTNKVRARLRI